MITKVLAQVAFDLGRRPWDGYPGCTIVAPWNALRSHSLNAAQYKEMLVAQDGVCAICAGTNYRWNQRINEDDIIPLFIDHDHSCCPDESRKGRSCSQCVRGLLCCGCNHDVGKVERGHAWEGGHYDRVCAYIANPPARRASKLA